MKLISLQMFLYIFVFLFGNIILTVIKIELFYGKGLFLLENNQEQFNLPLSLIENKTHITLKDIDRDFIVNTLIENSTNLTIGNITLYYNNKQSLALGPQVLKQSSIVYQLFEQKQIEKLIFGLEENTYLYLGGIPDKFNSYLKGTFSAQKDNKYWGFILKSIKVFNNEMIVNKFAYFNNQKFFINFPQEFYNFYNEVQIQYSQPCDEEIFYPLCFNIGNYEYTMEKKILKYRTGNFHYVLERNYNNTYLFGEDFFKAFSVFFDYSTKEVIVFSTKNIELIKDNINLTQKLLIVNNTELVIGIVLILIYFFEI